MRHQILCAILLLLTFSAFAESVTKEETLPPFGSVVASDQFCLTVREGSEYKLVLELDERVSDFCECIVKGSILYIQLNEREFSKELKAVLRKNPLDAKSLKAELTVPVTANLASIIADENVTVCSDGKFCASGKLSFILSDKASVKDFEAEIQNVELELHNTANFSGKIKAENLEIKGYENSVAKIDADVTNGKIFADNSTDIRLSGGFTNLNIETKGGLNWPKVNITGNAESLAISGRGYADINLSELQTKSLDAVLATCSCKANVSDSLKLEMDSGAKFYYEGTPGIEIVKINASTVGHFSDAKK